jgi:uncharacterized protein (DUF2062 family)
MLNPLINHAANLKNFQRDAEHKAAHQRLVDSVTPRSKARVYATNVFVALLPLLGLIYVLTIRPS